MYLFSTKTRYLRWEYLNCCMLYVSILTTLHVLTICCNVSLLMKRECPCSTKTREVLENPSPTALEISLDSWDFALEKFFGQRGWICQSSWWSAAPIQKTPFKLTTGKGGQSPAWEDLLTAELLLRHLWSEEAHHLTLATLFEIWPPCQLLPTPEIQRKSSPGKLDFSLQITVYSW